MGNISIHPDTRLGQVSFKVSDLARSVAYYTRSLGFKLIAQTESTATLGSEIPLLNLREVQNPTSRPSRSTGLYHAAFLLPSRLDLARLVKHLAENRIPFGQSDHLVSEALYMEDPDSNGLEIYRDRARDEWRWVGDQVQMAVDPIDFDSLMGELDGTDWAGMPDGTRLGHMHLRVGDIQEAESFYGKVMGFDLVFKMPSALFMSAGGYHHHLGLNTWHSLRGPRPPANAIGLESYSVVMPDQAALDDQRNRIARAGWATADQRYGFSVRDPWDNEIQMRVG